MKTEDITNENAINIEDIMSALVEVGEIVAAQDDALVELAELIEEQEETAMAKIYYKRIKAGIMTIDEVPERWRAAVQAMLDEDEA